MLRQGLLLLLSVMLLGSAAASPASNLVYGESEASRVLAQARGVAERAARNGIADVSEQQQIAAQLNAIAGIEALVERGRARISAQRMRQLQLAAEQLQAIPVAVTVDSRAPSALTTISGTVTAQGGAPLQNVSVRATEFSLGATVSSPNSGPGILATTNTTDSGQYTLTLPPGNYVVRAVPTGATLPASATGYLTRVHNDLACNNGFDCPSYFGTVIALTSGTPVGGIDLQLPVSGAISGTVLRASDSSPINMGSVTAQGIDGNTNLGAGTAADGSFTIKNVPPGTYRVWAGANTPAGLMNEALGNIPCSPDDCAWVPSTFINVTAGSTATAAPFTLDAAASLTGTVRDDTAAVVADAELTLYSEDRYTVQYAVADASGNYSFPAVRPGIYRLLAGPSTSDPNPPFAQRSTSHGQVAFPNVSCPGAVCAPLSAGNPITVTAGVPQVLAQITLPVGSTISGLVRDAGTLVPVAGAQISISNSAIGYVGSGITDAAGNYTVRGLPAGVYFVSADARPANYVLTHNGNVICPILNCEDFGTPVTLTASGPGSTATANIDLQRGGTITGSMTDAVSGAPATANRVRLELYGSSSNVYAQAAFQRCTPPTNDLPAACSYTATGLAPGTYKGAFISTSVLGWIDMAFGGTPCPRGGCDLTPLPPLFATTGSTLATINGTLPRGALVRGRISDAAGGGLPDCRAYDPAGSGFACGGVGFNNTLDNYAGFAQPDRAGNYYSRTGFAGGTTVYASTFLLRNNFSFGQGYVDQAYNGISCPYGSCGIASGTGITIPGTDVTGINFALNKGGSIAGQVSASVGGAAIAGVIVKVYNPAGRLAGVTRSRIGGDYRVYGLAPGSYFVTTTNTLGFLDEVHNNIVCEPFCNPVGGNAVVVSGTATTSAIDFALDLSATIQGTVRVGATPTANVPVELYGAIGNLLRSTSSNGSGGYAFSGLPAGRYFVRSRDTGGRADALFSGLPCVGNACQVRLGTPIDLAPPTTTLFTADLTLTAAATISGTITRADNSNPLSGVQVQLLTPSGAVALSTTSSGSGTFVFNGLAGGNYHLVTRGTPGFIDVAWPSAPCPAACSGLNGSSIPVVAGTTVSGRNFALQGGGSISGTLRSGPAAPIVGATVQVYNNSGVPVGQIATNASGNYQLDTLPSGNFFVRTQQNLGFVDQVFNALPCSGYCDVLSGTPVPVSSGVGTGLVDFTLAGGSSISGRVSSAASGSGIALARVVAFDSGGFIAGQAQANASGDYSIAGLRPGSYRLRSANLSGFINQVHAGLACSPTPCTLAAGTPIVLGAAPISGINFSLTPGGTISGTAGDSFNNPLPTGTALLLDATGAEVASVAIGNGVFEFNGVAIGTYYVLIRNTSGLVDQLYANVPCPGGACNITALGTPIVVTATQMEKSIHAGPANINLRLPVGQTIAGTVRDASNSAPLAGVTVSFFNSTGAVVGQAVTDGLGQYQSEGSLPSGNYFAATTNGVQRGVGSGYVNALYNAQNCLLACTFTSGTAIVLGASPITGIDFNLARAGLGLTGTVRNGSNQPLALVQVEVYDASGRLAGSATSNSQGVYAIDGLPAGNYFARTRNNLGLEDRLFGGGACGVGCNPLSGNAIAVPASAQIANINFVLTLPDPVFRNGFE